MNKILTFYSETHKKLYDDYFFPSYYKFLSKKYKLINCVIPQVCSSGEFASEGFDDAMFKKIELIIENIDVNDKNIFVFSDCDVQFFDDFEYDLENYDILFQEDYKNYKCAGFFICKQTEHVLNFFKLVRNEFLKYKNGKIDDQWVINKLLENNEYSLAYGFLPPNKYWSVGNATGGHVWNGQNIEIPNDLTTHHANFTIGLENKIKLLNIVKQKNEK